MSEIERILATGKSTRDDHPPLVDAAQFRSAEATLGFALPKSYTEFVALGGLGELRVNHRVLSPLEIVQVSERVTEDQYVPFADNGCGDLYCWRKTPDAEPEIVFADHETMEYTPDAPSFTTWLERNRF